MRSEKEIRERINILKTNKQKAKNAHEWASFHLLQGFIDLLEWCLD
jgi:hypothetical protein